MTFGTVRRTAALASAAAALVLATGTGSAQAQAARPATAPVQAPALNPGELGTLRSGETGLPSTVRIGQSIVMTAWLEQNSRYLLDIGDFATGVWSPFHPSTDGKGVTVSYLNAATGRWQSSPAGYYGEFAFTPEGGFLVRPNWAHITVRITFTSRARLGVWYISPGGELSYMLEKTVNGPEVPGTLAMPFGPWPGYKITVQR
jgi:hypothetical protein